MSDGADTTAGTDVGRSAGPGTAAALATQFGFALAVVACAAAGWPRSGMKPKASL